MPSLKYNYVAVVDYFSDSIQETRVYLAIAPFDILKKYLFDHNAYSYVQDYYRVGNNWPAGFLLLSYLSTSATEQSA